ncbi:hypothetical protein OG241_18020 [Streptomyces sp. NBC_01390]|uniref:hypothetical protein n=1 Tax=Streptomyces sp. NBC_01390 TaxID=2903850 RepID=UPI0032460042
MRIPNPWTGPALAVFGMYVVHIGPPLSATTGVAGWIGYLADGHSSVLFATLAAAAYGMSQLLAGSGALRSTAEGGPSSGGSGSMPLDSV